MKNDYKSRMEKLLGSDGKNLILNDSVAKDLYKMYNKDGNYFNRIRKVVYKICNNPDQSEKLTGPLTGHRSTHAGSKVLIFQYRNGNVYLEKIDEHDKAYHI